MPEIFRYHLTRKPTLNSSTSFHYDSVGLLYTLIYTAVYTRFMFLFQIPCMNVAVFLSVHSVFSFVFSVSQCR